MGKEVTLIELLQSEAAPELISGLSFEAGLRLMEQLVEQVESGSLPLQQAIRSYERGVGLVEHLRGLISGAEEKLRVLQKAAKTSDK